MPASVFYRDFIAGAAPQSLLKVKTSFPGALFKLSEGGLIFLDINLSNFRHEIVGKVLITLYKYLGCSPFLRRQSSDISVGYSPIDLCYADPPITPAGSLALVSRLRFSKIFEFSPAAYSRSSGVEPSLVFSRRVAYTFHTSPLG